MAEETPAFDDRATFNVAEAIMGVIRTRVDRFEDDDAVWEAFAARRGKAGEEYLNRIRAGGKYIFYSLLQDLYNFAEEVCGENIARAVGEFLADDL